jgi:hypothetical protein
MAQTTIEAIVQDLSHSLIKQRKGLERQMTGFLARCCFTVTFLADAPILFGRDAAVRHPWLVRQSSFVQLKQTLCSTYLRGEVSSLFQTAQQNVIQ